MDMNPPTEEMSNSPATPATSPNNGVNESDDLLFPFVLHTRSKGMPRLIKVSYDLNTNTLIFLCYFVAGERLCSVH